jgi:uncharacterized protein involved in outer membrane biogenesis
MLRRSLKWFAALLLTLSLLAYVLLAIHGWNWARAPLQHFVQDRTGRELLIGGDFDVAFAWPGFRVHANDVTFANPAWASEKQMLSVDELEFTVDLLGLFRLNLLVPQVRLEHPLVFLERAPDGRKTWLLDRTQSDDTSRITIERLTVERGIVGYDDAEVKTRIRAEVSTQKGAAGAEGADALVFAAKGIFKGLAFKADGRGGSALLLHDVRVPYPLNVRASLGRTGLEAKGTVTGMFRFYAADMRLALHGDSLSDLFAVTGIALPRTSPYALSGQLIKQGHRWRYEKFSGRVGQSDIGGTLQIDLAGARPYLHGDLVSQKLVLSDLVRQLGTGEAPAPASSRKARSKLLPDLPFTASRWKTVDANVTLKAASFARAKDLPVGDLVARMKLQDAVITLDPLAFEIGGGHLNTVVSLDGRKDPMQAPAVIRARRVGISGLFPAVTMTHSNIGEVNVHADLSGRGNSVADMLATSDGQVGLVVGSGELSKMLLEKISLHLLEILQLKLTGDKPVQLRCGVADFAVKEGVMNVNALVLDTDVSTITGGGTIDLRQEQLDLTLVPKTRHTSLVSLRGPIKVKGPLAKPAVSLPKGKIAARGLGALALATIRPVLALIPLVETGSDVESNCRQLIDEASAPPKKN